MGYCAIFFFPFVYLDLNTKRSTDLQQDRDVPQRTFNKSNSRRNPPHDRRSSSQFPALSNPFRSLHLTGLTRPFTWRETTLPNGSLFKRKILDFAQGKLYAGPRAGVIDDREVKTQSHRC